jgi:hypothetical protein
VPEFPIHLPSRRLCISRYDHAWSWLLALLLLFGAAVFILFMVWLSTRLHQVDIASPVELSELGDGEGGGDGRPSGGTQLESPNDSTEVPVTDMTPPEIQDTMATVAETVVEQVAALDDPSLQPPKVKGDYGSGGGSGGGHGPGRGLGHGKGRPGRPQRWEVRFPKGNSLESYARQLDFFKFELGVIGENDTVSYLSNFSAPKPTVKTGPRVAEKRMYLVWTGGDLKQADIEFFKRAGVSTEGGMIFMFLPPDVRQTLSQLELDKNHKTIAEISKTIFGLQTQGGGFVFSVIDQRLK